MCSDKACRDFVNSCYHMHPTMQLFNDFQQHISSYHSFYCVIIQISWSRSVHRWWRVWNSLVIHIALLVGYKPTAEHYRGSAPWLRELKLWRDRHTFPTSMMGGGCYGGSSNPKSLIILPLKSQIPNFLTPQIPKFLTPQIPNPNFVAPQIPNLSLNITKLLGIRNNYQHFMAFYMIPYNHDDRLII